jgi:dynein heavy chain
MYTKAGCADTKLLFILTDGQISKEKFLVYINDMLSSGWIPELFNKEELDTVLGKVRQAAKSEGIPDTTDDLFKFFMDRVRRNLHIALGFSPIGP